MNKSYHKPFIWLLSLTNILNVNWCEIISTVMNVVFPLVPCPPPNFAQYFHLFFTLEMSIITHCLTLNYIFVLKNIQIPYVKSVGTPCLLSEIDINSSHKCTWSRRDSIYAIKLGSGRLKCFSWSLFMSCPLCWSCFRIITAFLLLWNTSLIGET